MFYHKVTLEQTLSLKNQYYAQKLQIDMSDPPVEGLMGNKRTSSIPHWIANNQLSISGN